MFTTEFISLILASRNEKLNKLSYLSSGFKLIFNLIKFRKPMIYTIENEMLQQT